MRTSRLGFILWGAGLLLLATAQRRGLDLGQILPDVGFWSLTLASLLLLLVAAPPLGLAGSSPSPGTSRVLLLVGVALFALPPGPVLRAAGLFLVLSWALMRWKAASPTALRALSVFTVLALAQGWSSVWDALAQTDLGLPWAQEGLGMLFQAMGLSGGSAGSGVVCETMRGFRIFRVDAHSLGLPTQGLLFLGSLFWVHTAGLPWIRRGAWHWIVGFFLALLLRFVGVVAVGSTVDGLVDYDDIHFPMHGFLGWTTTGLIDLIVGGLVLLYWSLHGLHAPSARPAGTTRDRLSFPLGARATVAIGLLVGGLLATPRILDATKGRTTSRVAIDEGHSDWESTDIFLGANDYGTETGYNYRALADCLSFRFGPVRRLYEPITPSLLADVDQLVLKTPTRPYLPSEIRSLEAFVANGGGLFLIGDHTNVFGTSEVLNEIAERFGFRFTYDCLFDHRKRFELVYEPEANVARHPILAEVDKVRFEVGCSIEISGASMRPLVVARGMKSQMIDYAASNFYPQIEDQSSMRVGQFPVLVVGNHGRGRVVGLADSTFLSSFSICLPGRRELVIGAMEWLSGEDVGEGPRRVLWSSGWALFLLAPCLLWRRRRPVLSSLFLAGIALGLGVLPQAAYWRAHGVGSRPAGVEGQKEVLFHSASEEVIWPIDEMVRKQDRSFHLFFQWVLRTGRYPRLIHELPSDLDPGQPLFLLDPHPELLGDLAPLLSWIESGGNLVTLETRPNEFVSRIAAATGLEVTRPGPEERAVHTLLTRNGRVNLGGSASDWRRIRRGLPLLLGLGDETADPTRLAAVREWGQGALVVVTCGEVFTDQGYGMSYSVVPDDSRRRLFQFQFDLIEALQSKRDQILTERDAS